MDMPPNVLALPLEEARVVLDRAGWACSEVVETSAPRLRERGPSAGPAAAGDLLVVRQQVVAAGSVRLTVACHPGHPTEDTQRDPDREEA